MLLQHFPPMGVYETLFAFADATNKYMGDPNTHPWAQGFPLTVQLPGGPPLPGEVSFESADLKYPSATGQAPLLNAIADYYNEFYGANITSDNVAVFAGGRPAIYATLAFLNPGTNVAVEETEYPPYWDALELLNRKYEIIPSNPGNSFRPQLEDYPNRPMPGHESVMLLTSNPCNPTGVAKSAAELEQLVQRYSQPGTSALFDEAYEFFADPKPQSAIEYIDDIDQSEIFIVSAATKGLQVPGMRIGWIVAAKQHIEIFRNFSSIAMGGVSRPAQIYVTELLQLDRVRQARDAVGKFYTEQRMRYRDGLSELGFELYTGEGGFYHWGRLPNDLTAAEFNRRLFEHNAGVLPGPVCDMKHRRGPECPLDKFVRFSFGPLPAETYDQNIQILKKCLAS